MSCLYAGIKSADLAGSWYPRDPFELREIINRYLLNADPSEFDGDVVALIVPHAGLAYSGQTAAYAFKVLTKENISTVIVVGFSHRKNYDAIAVLGAEGVKTPLGALHTDGEIAGKLIAFNGKIIRDDGAFDNENSVEMILPFIQAAWGDKKIVLLAIGAQSYENSLILGEAIYAAVKERSDIAIIASTDMSHYLPLVLAEKTDNLTLGLVKDMDPYKTHMQCIGQNRMCGTAAVSAVMFVSKKLGADRVEILYQSTSAQSQDPKEKVVGYLSAAFVRSKNANNKKEMIR